MTIIVWGSFDFCEPGEDSKDKDPVENLGQVVFGERLRASAYEVGSDSGTPVPLETFLWPSYQIKFAKSEDDSKLLCWKNYTNKKDDMNRVSFLYDRIHENYMQQWVIDNMPVTWCYSILESKDPYCTTRFPVGCYVTPEGVRHDACYLSVSLISPIASSATSHFEIL